MEPKIDPPKMPDMVVFRSMCGDHQSITKTELNIKEDHEDKLAEKEKNQKERIPGSYARITPSTSCTERGGGAELELRAEARRRVRGAEAGARHEDGGVGGNRALVQAALGSFRWPPYLVAIWVLVLLMTHALHCLVTVLERALPALKKFSTYFRTWTEESWKGDADINARVYPLGLAFVTGLLYALYFGLYAIYAVALWSVEPLCTEEDKRDDAETKITNYVNEVNSKTYCVLNK